MYIEKLNGNLQCFLKNEDETICNDIDENLYMKIPITKDVVAIYMSNQENIEHLNLLFYYSKSKKDIIMTFNYSKELDKKIDKIVLTEVFNTLVNKEFRDLIETIEINDIDMNFYKSNKEFMENVKVLYQKNYNYNSEIFYRKDIFTPEELVKIGTNIYDFAYEEMEKNLTNENLLKIKKCAITQKMINFPELYIGKEFLIEKELLKVVNLNYIKDLKLTIETGTGSYIQKNVKNSSDFYKHYPCYAITKIEIGEDLYVRNETLATIYKDDLEYNKNLSEEQFIYIPKKWFDNEEFVECMSLKTEKIYSYMSERLKDDKDFILKLMKTISFFHKETLYKHISKRLRLDKDFLMYLMTEIGVHLFKKAEICLQIEEDVLELYFKNTSQIDWSNELRELLFEYPQVQECFSRFYCNRKNILIQSKYLKYITEINIAISCAKLDENKCNFEYFSENMRHNNTFVSGYIKEITRKESLKKIDFMSVYNFLSLKQQEDEILCCELISKFYIENKQDYQYNIKDCVKTNNFTESMLMNNLNMFQNLAIEEQEDLLKRNPKLIKYSYLSNQINFCEEHMDVLEKMVKIDPTVLKYFTISEDKTLKKILSFNPKGFKFIIHNLKTLVLDTIKDIQDKEYVLNEIVTYYRLNNLKIFSTTESNIFEFLFAQIKIKDKDLTSFIKMKDLVTFDKIYHTKFQDNEKLIYTLAKENPNAILNLPKSSIYRMDKILAKFVLKNNIDLKSWFHPCIWKDKSFVKEIYDSLDKKQKERAMSFFIKFL